MILRFPTQVFHVSVWYLRGTNSPHVWAFIKFLCIPWCLIKKYHDVALLRRTHDIPLLNLTEICRKRFFYFIYFSEIPFCYNKTTVFQHFNSWKHQQGREHVPVALFSQKEPDKGWSLSQLYMVALLMPCSPVVHPMVRGGMQVS